MRKKWILIITITILLIIGGIYTTNYLIEYNKINTLYIEDVLPYERTYKDEKRAQTAKQIGEKYGIEIMYNVPSTVKEYFSENYGYNFSDKDYESSDVDNFLAYLDDTLEAYNQETIELFPHKWFTVPSLRIGWQIISGVTAEMPHGDKFMIFSTLTYLSETNDNREKALQIINHELFHAVLFDMLTKEQINEYNAIDEKCSDISCYACVGLEEEMAEAWGFEMSGKTTKKGDYLLSVFGEKVLTEDYLNYLKENSKMLIPDNDLCREDSIIRIKYK